MNQESIKGISIYIDMRNSTKLNKESKINEIRKFYNPSIIMILICQIWISHINNQYILKCTLNNKSFILLGDTSDKVKDISHDDIKYGVGIAYGEISCEIYLVNGNNQSIPMETSVDLAAKASNLGNKGPIYHSLYPPNKSKTISSELNIDLRDFMHINTT